MDFMRQRVADQLRADSRALLGAAYAAVGDTESVDELLARLGALEAIERQTGGNFDSTIRSRALLLLARRSLQIGDFDVAEDYLDQAMDLELGPDEAAAIRYG